MVLKVTSGYSPEYLLKEVATGRENYYTGAVAEGEPPGRWWGAGAERLGLAGLVDAQDMRAVYERFLDPRVEGFKDPEQWESVSTLGHTGRKYISEDELYAASVEREPNATPERLAELRVQAGKMARHNVAFFDITFSVQKSVTLLHTAFEAQEVAARNAGDEETAAAWGEFRKAVEDAIWAGNNAALSYLSEKAGYSRVGHHGGEAGRWVDAHDWVVASFFQHDSRDHDPQLHIHNGTLNRVEGPDGQWRTLDSKALFKFRPAAAAVGERSTEERLTHDLGVLVATRPDGKAREIVGIPQHAMDLVSTRRHKVAAKAAELVSAFETSRGRAPNGLEHDRITQQATLATRARKSHTGETREQLLDRIDARIRADIDGGLSAVAHMALAARENGVQALDWSPSEVIEVALEQVQQSKAGWTRADLTGAINAALPDYLGIPDGADVARLLDSLTEEALQYATLLDAPRPGDDLLPDELKLANGQSAYLAPGARLYATPDQVRTERALVSATAADGATALPRQVTDGFLAGLDRSGIRLGVDQAAAVHGVLTSGARVESLVGPAGTGKSFVVGMIARGWTDPNLAGGPERRVFGLATSQIATDVLTAEGLTARNVARWLATQQRLSTPVGSDVQRPSADDRTMALRAGDLVVVDESAMTDTAALAAIHKHVDTAGAKLLLVGDHRQLAAVGAGGGMDLLAHAGQAYELTEARRFTAEWERAASLRLRDGDESVLRDYYQHGRLLDSGTREQAEQSAANAWLADTLAGQHSILLVDTNEQAGRLSMQLRADLVRLGRVDETGVQIADGGYAGAGDLVQARRNGWDLAKVEENTRGPINRETYRVLGARGDGGLDVELLPTNDEDTPQRMVLPAEYARAHITLGYASTVHAAQGMSVDTSHAVITAGSQRAAVYVALSRGRDSNLAHVATTATVDDPAHGSDRHDLHRDPIAVLAGLLEDRDPTTNQSALAIAANADEVAGSMRTAVERLADAAHLAATARTVGWLDGLVTAGHLTPEHRARIAAEDGAPSLTRVLRRAEIAGHDPHQILTDAIAERPLAGANNTTNVIHNRITAANTRTFDPIGETWADWIPAVNDPQWRTYVESLAAAADQRTLELGEQAVTEEPDWAVNLLGRAPEASDERQDWTRRAGQIAAYRELRGLTDNQDEMTAAGDVPGSAPKPGQVEEYAAYRAAWRHLGRPEIDQREHQMSDAQHRMRVRAWEREQAWGPRYVGHELAGTRQAADHHRRTASLKTAEADATTDPGARDRLLLEAHQASSLATTLDDRARELEDNDTIRAQWLAHSAATCANAEISAFILAQRHAGDEPEPRITAEEWLATDTAARHQDDAHRNVSEHDLAHTAHEDEMADVDEASDASTSRQLHRDHESDAERTNAFGSDVREIASLDTPQRDQDVVRIPSAEEAADSTERAYRALAEIYAREPLDAQADEDERAAELARWHSDDLDTAQEDDHKWSAIDEDEPVMTSESS